MSKILNVRQQKRKYCLKPVLLQTQAPSRFYCSRCFVVSLLMQQNVCLILRTTSSQLTSLEENQDLTTSSRRQQQYTCDVKIREAGV